MMRSVEDVLTLLDRKISHRQNSVKGIINNPVNIKQKRSIQKQIDAIKLLKRIKSDIINTRGKS